MCLRLRSPQRNPPPITQYTITTNGKLEPEIVRDSHGRQLCRFSRILSHEVVNNIYRVFGRLAVASSAAEVALFYRNTVGKGGYIEFFSDESPEAYSLLPSFLSRFQPARELDEPPTRVHILAKLSGCTCEIYFELDHTKLLWSADDRKLYKIEGLFKQEAASISLAYCDQNESIHDPSSHGSDHKSTTILHSTSPRYSVMVQTGLLNPYLAVCVCLYFLLLENDH